MKRLSLILISFILCCSLVFGCISVSAEDTEVNGYTVVNYQDYITGYDLYYAGDGWAYLSFDADMFTSYKEDINGWESDIRGTRLWNLSVKNDQEDFSAYVTSQIPGGGMNGTFLDLSNIPNGSVFQIQAFVDLDDYYDYQTEILITIFSGIKYYDENFKYISGYHDEENSYSFETGLADSEDSRFSQLIELTVNQPDNAKYCVLYSRCEFGIGRSNDPDDYINFGVQFLHPSLKISTSYTQLIINAIVNAKLPEGHGTIVSVGELEAILNGTAQQGQQSADDLFQSGPEVIEQFLTAFTFMNLVFTSISGHHWLSSILTVSLALGLFNFLVNGVESIGAKIEVKKAKAQRKQQRSKAGKRGG